MAQSSSRSSSNNTGKSSREVHMAWLVFECAFCKTKSFVGQGGMNPRETYSEIDALIRDGCYKCGGRIVFKERVSK